MIIVSDSSSLISLAIVGRLDLLRELYGRVVIPAAVHREITQAGAGLPGAREISSARWIEIVTVTDQPLVATLARNLGDGEAEAVALALQLKADLLLMDERRGRAVAAQRGLRIVGLLGVVLEAKHRRQIPAVKPMLDALMDKAGMWLDQPLYKRTLRAAGE